MARKMFVVYNSGLFYTGTRWTNDVHDAKLFSTYDDADHCAGIVGGVVLVEYV